MTRTSFKRLRLLAPLIAVASLTIGATPASADTEISRTGNIGAFHVYDGEEGSNGAYCSYNSNKGNRLRGIGTRAPDMWARDVTPGEDTQAVAWRVIIKRQKPGAMALTTYYRSKTQRDTATDTTPAPFTHEGYGVGQPGFDFSKFWTPREPGEGSRYWIFVRMFWYGSDGRLEGTATHRLDEYMWVLYPPGYSDYGDTSCHGRLVLS
jgi:hypothetical protein